MKTVSAGTPVKSGYYFSLNSWTVQPMAHDGEQLPGERGEQWIPMSLPLAVAAAPLLGAGFLMFLPAIGFFLVAQAAARPITNLFQKATTELAASMSPGLVPGESYLTGKRGEEEATPEEGAAGAGELESLKSEVESKRTPRA